MSKRTEDLEGLLDSLLPPPIAAARPIAPPAATCSCDGSGWIHTVDDKGNRSARECGCKAEKRIQAKLAGTKIPERYRTATLDSFDALNGHPSLARGLAAARRFAEEYPIGTNGRGLLLIGPVGVGKTHLAVGVLRKLVLEKGASGVFTDFRDLLGRIKRTFGKTDESEAGILDPLFAADVLVLDELGAAQVTDWTFDRVELIVNTRYNDNRSTIITTNLPNRPPGVPAEQGSEYGRRATDAMRGESLGDRIGARMHSRLQQMCQLVEMTGEDYRSKKR